MFCWQRMKRWLGCRHQCLISNLSYNLTDKPMSLTFSQAAQALWIPKDHILAIYSMARNKQVQKNGEDWKRCARAVSVDPNLNVLITLGRYLLVKAISRSTESSWRPILVALVHFNPFYWALFNTISHAGTWLHRRATRETTTTRTLQYN